VLCLALGMVVIDNTILNVAIPRIAQDLHSGQSGLEWITSAYGLVLSGLLLPLAVVGDRRGRHALLLVGLVVFGLASGLAALAGSVLQLTLCRGLMGVGGACAMPGTLSLLGSIFPEHERGRAIAIWSGVAGVAAAAGPLVGGLLLAHFWWGSVFLVNVPIAAVAIVAAIVLVPPSRDPGSPTLDPLSSLTWWASLTAALVAIIEGPTQGWRSPLVLGAGAAAVVLFLLFRRNEARSARPLVDAATARDPRMQAGVATMASVFFAFYGLQFVLTQWMQGPDRLSPFQAGVCFLPSALVSVVASLTTSRRVSRHGAGVVAIAGLVLVGVSGVGATLAVHAGSRLGVIVALIVAGAGIGTAAPCGSELIMSSAPAARSGSAAGVNETVVEAAGALGVAALGSVLGAGAGFSWPLPLAAAAAFAGAAVVARSVTWRRRPASRPLPPTPGP